MSLCAAMTRASSGRSSTRGTTSAARIPRITMTTSTSISVKPMEPRGSRAGDPGRVSCADYNPPVRRARVRRDRLHPILPPVSRTSRSLRPRRGDRSPSSPRRGGVALGWWLAAAAAVAGVAVRVRREAGREPQVRRARSRPRGCPAARAAARRAGARSAGVDRSIKAGNYEIAAGITLPRLLDKLTQGDVTQTALTVVEGGTFAEFAAALSCESRDRQDACWRCPTAELAQRIGVPGRVSKAGSFRTPISSRRARPISRSSRARTG